ncbi:hypothetical protein [Nostoc sp. CHAB 5836]|nr:hypothetical protein [Nostoc sp. CHAB 5836]
MGKTSDAIAIIDKMTRSDPELEVMVESAQILMKKIGYVGLQSG